MNKFTEQKQLFPIINSSKKINREKLKMVYSESLQLLLEIEIDLIFTLIDIISLGGIWIRLARIVETSIY